MLGRLKKRWWVNLALLALVATLVLLVVFEPGKKQPESLPKLTNVSTDMVVRVRLLRPGLEDITLEKGPAGWRLSAPLKARANDFVVDNLASAERRDQRHHHYRRPSAGRLRARAAARARLSG
ncbi:MAG: hypothetical protein JSW09_09340 [Pseudomonadota bacterium]|nr:MAG: hypothetical protein JSW09_09340 [Pseudomonadota bacterium]